MMKSNQVIFGDLSNSGRKCVWSFSFNFWLTKWILRLKNIKFFFVPTSCVTTSWCFSVLSNASVTFSGACYLSNYWIFALPDMTNINMIYRYNTLSILHFHKRRWKLWKLQNTSLQSKKNNPINKLPNEFSLNGVKSEAIWLKTMCQVLQIFML